MNENRGVIVYPEKYFLISDYQSMELLGVKGLFTNLRVDRESLPEGFFKYSLREGDDGWLSSVENNVVVNHMGDFVCKQELNLNGQDEYDIFDEYGFTDDEVDLDRFFGVDIKAKIATELDEFYYNFDTHDYNDKIPSGCTREDVVISIKDGLSDKEYVSGMVEFFEKLLQDNEEEQFLSDKDEQKVHAFICVLSEINTHNRDGLDFMVKKANEAKENQVQGEQNKQPEIQQ